MKSLLLFTVVTDTLSYLYWRRVFSITAHAVHGLRQGKTKEGKKWYNEAKTQTGRVQSARTTCR